MKLFVTKLILISIITFTLIPSTHAADVTIPNSFQSGATAVASEVNANFSAVETAVNDNNRRVAELESTVATLLETISTLQDRIVEFEDSQVMALESFVTVDEVSDSRGPLVLLSGVNFQVVNGAGQTNSINGLGNIIIGYDEINDLPYNEYCSDGLWDNETDCTDNSEAWGISHKSGSHYLVLGSRNNYSQYGGLVSGFANFSTGIFSNVTGGYNGAATGEYSIVSGGLSGHAAGDTSSVSGGVGNIASGDNSSVSGGYTNTASGYVSSVLGGYQNEAAGNHSSVSGGSTNTASGTVSSVSGGRLNEASGESSTVGGGYDRDATSIYDWRAGTLFEGS
jgi:hypothetical protein